MLSRIIFAVILAPTIAFAQSESKEKLAPKSFHEVLKSAAEISGARVVGMARFGSYPRRADDIPVEAYVPQDWAGQTICLSVMSVDGFYQSLGDYAVSEEWPGGVVSLVYPSEAPAKLKEFGTQKIAPLLTKGECNTGGDQTSTVFWGEQSDQNTYLLLNTSRSEETYLFFPDYPDMIDIACEQSNAANRTAFDTICSLPADLSATGPLKAGTVSFKNGEMGREVEFVIYPAGE